MHRQQSSSNFKTVGSGTQLIPHVIILDSQASGVRGRFLPIPSRLALQTTNVNCNPTAASAALVDSSALRSQQSILRIVSSIILILLLFVFWGGNLN